MSHDLEIVNGQASCAYSGEVPWHGLGKQVPADLSAIQMLEAAGLDWNVDMLPTFIEIDGEKVDTGNFALVRDRDNKILDLVGPDWNPVQNSEAFEFFHKYVAAGDMEMHTAGSLKGGQIVWGLAKLKETFELFGGDVVESHLLFTNYHKYGYSNDVRFTPTRVVCNNTLQFALGQEVDRMVKITHHTKFDPGNVEELLGITTAKFAKYKEIASFLGSKKAPDEDVVEYFTRIFPVVSSKDVPNKEFSKNAVRAFEILHTQPGHEFAEGTWWQSLQAVTFVTDHLAGKTNDNRMFSAWYGQHRQTKLKAVELAMEYAEAA